MIVPYGPEPPGADHGFDERTDDPGAQETDHEVGNPGSD
jgi:hypothetical protein